MVSICQWTAAVLALSHFTDASFGNAGSTGYSCPTVFNFYGDAYDCTKFYRCFWGEAYSFKCPAGTRWNQEVLTCDHEYNVPCHGAGSQYEDGHVKDVTTSTQTVHADYDNDDYAGGDQTGGSYDYQNHGEPSYYYQSKDDGYNKNNYHYNSNYGGQTSPGYYDKHHQTQTLTYTHPPRIAYYDYSGRPSYVNYGNNHRGYHNPKHNFLAYNNFMAALGYKKK